MKFKISLAVVLSVIAAVFFLYLNVFYSPFTFDDIPNIIDNQKIRDLSNFWDLSGTRFVAYLSFALNFHFSGLNPFGYHITNFIIHIICGALVYLLVTLTFKTSSMAGTQFGNKPAWFSATFWIAVTVAIIFLVHPVQTQSVNYITQRLASLVALFYLLALVTYIKARLSWIEGKRNIISVGFYLLSIISTILAMKTKETSFTLPFMIALYEVAFFKSNNDHPITGNKKRLFYILPFLFTLPIIPFSDIDAGVPLTEVDTAAIAGRLEYLFTQFRVIVTYIRLLFIPVNQNLDYDYPIYTSFLNPQVFLSFFFLLGVLGFALYVFLRSWVENNGKNLLISFGVIWFFITLSVESSIIPLLNVIFEHRLYLPSVGVIISFIVCLSSGFEWVGKKWETLADSEAGEENKRRVFIAAISFLLFISVIVIPLSIFTYKRNLIWKDNFTLWGDTVAKSPNKGRPHNNLGLSYLMDGRLDDAMREFRVAIEREPDYAEPYNNLGSILFKMGSIEQAIDKFKAAVRVKPVYPHAHNNLGSAYFKKGLLKEAIGEYEVAVKQNSDYVKAHYNMGLAYKQLGDFMNAENKFKDAISSYRFYFKAYRELGDIYARQKRYDLSIAMYENVLAIDPENSDAFSALKFLKR